MWTILVHYHFITFWILYELYVSFKFWPLRKVHLNWNGSGHHCSLLCCYLHQGWCLTLLDIAWVCWGQYTCVTSKWLQVYQECPMVHGSHPNRLCLAGFGVWEFSWSSWRATQFMTFKLKYPSQSVHIPLETYIIKHILKTIKQKIYIITIRTKIYTKT